MSAARRGPTLGESQHVPASLPPSSASPELDHERLDAYRVALELDRLVVQICERAGRGFSWLCDQAQRASGSSALNLAEAVGRQGADRAQRYRIARGSALEVGAALSLLGHRRACSPELRGQARALTVRLVSMLTRLVALAR
jgi:four helix bundle protein